MSAEFDLNELKQILKDCPEYKRDHHLGRPFMSAYQIAIRFAEKHPQHPQVRNRKLGGQGEGPEQSLAQRIARFLSKAVKNKEPDIEGGFISHGFIGGGPWFVDGKGQAVRPSGGIAHSIFRWARKAGAN